MGDDPVRQKLGVEFAHTGSDSPECDALEQHKELLLISSSVREMSIIARRMSGTVRATAKKLREENGLMRQRALKVR